MLDMDIIVVSCILLKSCKTGPGILLEKHPDMSKLGDEMDAVPMGRDQNVNTVPVNR